VESVTLQDNDGEKKRNAGTSMVSLPISAFKGKQDLRSTWVAKIPKQKIS
jgi:hypothetical protein